MELLSSTDAGSRVNTGGESWTSWTATCQYPQVMVSYIDSIERNLTTGIEVIFIFHDKITARTSRNKPKRESSYLGIIFL